MRKNQGKGGNRSGEDPVPGGGVGGCRGWSCCACAAAPVVLTVVLVAAVAMVLFRVCGHRGAAILRCVWSNGSINIYPLTLLAARRARFAANLFCLLSYLKTFWVVATAVCVLGVLLPVVVVEVGALMLWS